jgi:SnoaL-like domain
VERAELVRTIVEECWSTPEGLDRMARVLSPDYVHHTPWGDWDFDGFRTGLGVVGERFADRTYSLVHLVDDGTLTAAFLTWTATRVGDGSRVDGSGAYHCRIADGLVVEDWDAFFPSS